MKKKKIKKALRNIAKGAEDGFPRRWLVIDIYAINLMREAADTIEQLQKELKKYKNK